MSRRASVMPTITLQEHLKAMRDRDAQTRLENERDLRYQQRWEAQNKAVETAMIAAEKAVQAALLFAERAVGKAEIATEKRFESVNEFRAQLADQSSTLLTRTEYLAGHKALEEKITGVKENQSASTGASQAVANGWKYVLAAGMFLLGLAGVILAGARLVGGS
jgi:alpha-D-ribose 1-methylphosphonate 5-triphosphate synthase subunit PhnH